MRLFAITLFLFVSVVFADENYSGWKDTSSISEILAADTLKYAPQVFELSKGEDIRVITKIADTSEAGFASDSMEFFWGYQTGVPVLNYDGSRDTAWDVRITLDTVSSTNMGSMPVGHIDSTGALFRSPRNLDTANVSGYAVQSKWFVPEWDTFIRFWAQGLADNNPQANIIMFDVKRRTYVSVRDQ